MVMLRGPQSHFFRISFLFQLLVTPVVVIAAGVRPELCSAGQTREIAQLVILSWVLLVRKISHLIQSSLRTEKFL